MRIFLAGASGVIGRRLIPLLIGAGHVVTGTTRIGRQGRGTEAQRRATHRRSTFSMARRYATPWSRSRPDVVIHQLTDLPAVFDPSAAVRRARAQLPAAHRGHAQSGRGGAGRRALRRLIAQSIAFAYAEGPEPHAESDPLAAAEGDQP